MYLVGQFCGDLDHDDRHFDGQGPGLGLDRFRHHQSRHREFRDIVGRCGTGLRRKVTAGVEKAMKDNVIPGAVVLISSPDQGDWTGTFGTGTWAHRCR